MDPYIAKRVQVSLHKSLKGIQNINLILSILRSLISISSGIIHVAFDKDD